MLLCTQLFEVISSFFIFCDYTRLLSNPFRKFINWLWKNFRSIIKRKFSLRRLRFRPCHFDWQLNVLWKAFKVSDFLYASARNLSCHPIYEEVDVIKKLTDLFDIYQGNSFFNSSNLFTTSDSPNIRIPILQFEYLESPMSWTSY